MKMFEQIRSSMVFIARMSYLFFKLDLENCQRLTNKTTRPPRTNRASAMISHNVSGWMRNHRGAVCADRHGRLFKADGLELCRYSSHKPSPCQLLQHQGSRPP